LTLQGLLEHLQKGGKRHGREEQASKKGDSSKTLLGMNKFIDKKKQPKSVNFMKLLMSVLLEAQLRNQWAHSR
jgi:uncharacterized radical SAM superfamily Fe-S cluster-containing enzyme